MNALILVLYILAILWSTHYFSKDMTCDDKACMWMMAFLLVLFGGAMVISCLPKQ